MATVLILLGGPGAGKGTQAMRLSEARSLPHVSTGDLFRAHLGRGTRFGLKAKAYMDAGKLVPDEIVLDMLVERVAAPDCRAGYVLDGFPRTLAQAQALDRRLAADDDLRVFNLDTSDETIVARIAGRRQCRDCGRLYHVEFSPPRAEGVCDDCRGELFQREDDGPEVVQERLRVYHEQTAPLIRFYADKGVLVNLDGEQAPDRVYAQLDAALARVPE